MNKQVIILASFLALAALAEARSASSCESIIENYATTSQKTFANNVAQGIYHITLEDLQKYFNPEATESNGVPTVSRRISEESGVEENAPKLDLKKKHRTVGMNVMQDLLMNEDDPNYGVKGLTMLEKFVVTFHLKEIYAKTQVQYEALKANPPASDVCACMTNVEENGIRQKLELVANALKHQIEPDSKLKYSDSDSKTEIDLDMFEKHNLLLNMWLDFDNNDELLARQMSKTAEDIKNIPALLNPKAWAIVKAKIKSTPETLYKNLAAYLYCKLK